MNTGEQKDKVIVILGPTAVGKTALSLSLARALNTEIISGDSMLVYRGFDIGTAKPTEEEQRMVPHHLVDIRSPEEKYSVTEFQQEAGSLIHEMNQKGKIPLVVGGTGLYLQALLEGYDFNAMGENHAYRSFLEKLAEEKGEAALFERLRRIDAKAAEGIDAKNIRRVVRALEVAELGQESISRRKKGKAFDAFVIGLSRPRPELYHRIDQRVEQMMKTGLENEVRGLLAMGVKRSSQAMQGIGYKEMACYLAGECTLEDAVNRIKKATRHFAKRQITWYRRMGYIHWFAIQQDTGQRVLARIFFLLFLAGFSDCYLENKKGRISFIH